MQWTTINSYSSYMHCPYTRTQTPLITRTAANHIIESQFQEALKNIESLAFTRPMNTFEQTFEHDTMASSLNQHTRETISPDISLRREEDSAEEKSFKETGQMRQSSLGNAIIVSTMGKKDHKATTVSALNPKTSTEDSILNIVNETEEQICQLPFDNASQLQLIYDFIENSGLNQMRPFKLCENLFDDDALPLALEMSKLPSRKVYMKIKKYADEGQLQQERIIRLSCLNNLRYSIPLQQARRPIGITQASKYEQFQVIKINARGVHQERILGIDQVKIYNYDRSVRKDKKNPGFIQRILGADAITGTKRPYRLVEGLKEINQTQSGLQLVFADKEVDYVVEAQQIAQRIIRKLEFLIAHHQHQKSNQAQKPCS